MKSLEKNEFTQATIVAVMLLLIACPMFSSSNSPAHDDDRFFLPKFNFVANSLQLGYGIPHWDVASGNTPLSGSALSLSIFMPHRAIGYILTYLGLSEVVTAYEWSLFIALMIAAMMWQRCLYILGFKFVPSLFGTLVAFGSGMGMTVFHQEQLLGAFFWMPIILFCVVRFTSDFRYIFPLCIFVGQSLCAYYPQIYILSFLFFLISVGVVSRARVAECLKIQKKRLFWILLGTIGFLVAAGPTLTIVKDLSNYTGYARLLGRLTDIKSLEDFMNIGHSRVDWTLFRHAFGHDFHGHMDHCTFFITYTGLVSFFLGLVIGKRRIVGPFLLFLFSIWAMEGLKYQFPQLLYRIGFPFIGTFRAWFDFAGLYILAISFIATVGLEHAVRWNHKFKNHVALLIFGVTLVECIMHSRVYISKFMNHEELPYRLLDQRQFNEMIATGDPTNPKNMFNNPRVNHIPFLIFRDRAEASLQCPKINFNSPTVVATGSTCDNPREELLPESDFEFKIDGFRADLNFTHASTVSFPVSPLLRGHYFLDGENIVPKQMFLDSKIAFEISPGKHEIKGEIRENGYHVALLGQFMVLLIGIIGTIKLERDRKISDNAERRANPM